MGLEPVNILHIEFYTQREMVPLQSSLDSYSKNLKPEETIRSSLLTFWVAQS